MGKNISIVRSLDNDPELADKILKITTDTGWQGEILNRKKDGTEFPISLSTSVVQNEKGETPGMVGVAVDISERKQTEKALQESELKYRNLIETMPDGFYRSTPEGKFLEVNEAMVKMLGYGSKEELLAVDIKTQLYFKPEDRESRVLQENPLELDVYPLKKKDGSAVWVEDHGWYVKDKAGNIIYHEGISRDITERKIWEMQLQKYSEKLQELNASKDKFFSIIAHDLKTPFNSILGFSEILKDEARNLDIETIEQYAGIINSTSKNTFRLLENLLDWARIQQSQILFRPGSVILKKLVAEVVETLIEIANSKLIAIINCIPDNLVVTADEDMLKTILRNLVSNALKFTAVNGKIEIKSVSKVHAIEISVEDNGTGIKQDDIDKIFKIGSGFTKRGTGNEKGTGLGLMLCKEFVEKHGGKIWVKSEEGKGSTFTFSINQNE
ncbi:MAG: PAS domain-containing sensor histidine kinase [Bacteroidota bacterium]|nr:PAS domain-containing sensor histidine kinase [Bacteroidota bacterium]